MQVAAADTTRAGRVVRLDRRSVLRVNGSQAHEFLQNLLTCDLDAVDSDGIGYGALLAPQGKILFDFLVFKDQDPDGGYLFDISSQIAEDFAKRLTFYKLRADVAVTQLGAELAVLAAWDAAWTTNLSGIARADPRHPAFASRILVQAAETDPEQAPDGFEWSTVDAYDARRVAFGLPEAPTDFGFGDAFPHDADMDDLNGVAFDKGCFVGQEVVSRMQHRGTARRRIIKVSGTSALPAPGTAILAGGKPAGTLGTTDGVHGLALVRLDRIATARAKTDPIVADGVALTAELPDWARFTWPQGAANADAS